MKWCWRKGISVNELQVYNNTRSYGDSCFACLVYKDKLTPCFLYQEKDRGLRDKHVQMLHLTNSQPPNLHY